MKNNKSIWDDFTNMYSVSKTLRFELKPISKTLKYVKEKGIIEKDEEREKEFNKIKKIMDEYYKFFIEKCLSNIKIKKEDMEAYRKVYEDLKKDPKNQKLKIQYEKNQATLRKVLFKEIKNQNEFKDLFTKEFVNKLLPIWLKENKKLEDKTLVEKFSKWTTYFKGFFDNRKNVFSEKEIPTSIIYRIVHDNLPKYLDNLTKLEKLLNLGFNFKELELNLKNELDKKDINSFFLLENFNLFLNQNGINKYNLIVGGKSEKNNLKIKGLNEYINEYAQHQKKEDGELDKKKQRSIRKLKFTPLFKQILSDRESGSFVLEKFNNEREVLSKIDDFYKGTKDLKGFKKISKQLYEILKKLNESDLNNIYLKNDNSLTQISQNVFGEWSKIKEGLEIKFRKELESEVNNNGKPFTENQINNKLNTILKSKFFSLNEIENCIKLMDSQDKKIISIVKYFLEFQINDKHGTKIDLFKDIEEKYLKLLEVYEKKTNNSLDKFSEKENQIIKQFLDSIMNLYHFIRPLHIHFRKGEDEKGSDALELDSHFYNDFNEIFEEIRQIIPLYNKVRNFVTKKPFSTKKFKLNFENSTLADGWDENKEKDNYVIILRKFNTQKKDYNYYLGIMSGEDKKIFEKIEPIISKKEDCFEKIKYKLLPGPDKMLPKVFFSEKNINFYKPSSEILKIRNTSSHTKNGSPQKGFKKGEFNTKDCQKMINFFKHSIKNHPNWKYFEFKFKENYEDISEFYKEISDQGYKIDFVNLEKSYIDKLVDEGKLYLFQIWNKDFSNDSKGKPNLHTIYWKELFSEENLKNVVYKLNGEAELFYRKASLKTKISHPKNQPIKNRNPINGKEESNFKYDLIKDKRYTQDKFLFHCPITLNFKAKDRSKIIHKLVNKFLHDSKEPINILGIDRGERNLVYYTLINSNGEIIKQESFNIISDDLQRKFDYHERLDQVEGDRDKARKNWKKICNIKEMKAGFLSKVVHDIAKLAIENNSIIIFEDLNFGFKRGRFKIEKQVYQNFEKKLIDKLNYLIFKDSSKEQKGGVLNAYQLTNKFDSFKKLGKQSGVIYYVDAYKTSNICPKTGFVNLLYPKFENIEKSKIFLKNFEYIKYNKNEDLFEFNFNYSRFSQDKKTIYHNLKKDNWSVWSNGIKLINKRDKENNNNWKTFEYDITKELKKLLESQNIDYISGENLIQSVLKIKEKSFFESFLYSIRIVLQLRNSYSDYEVKNFKKDKIFIESKYDYILSGVKDKHGNFFDSRKSSEMNPKNADANGAYHIALKGLLLLDKIKKSENVEKVDRSIKREDFINYVIERNL
jgi:CRISPR-associated protein Cpf1